MGTPARRALAVYPGILLQGSPAEYPTPLEVAGRDAMFGGERINATEDRAVLHTALRLPADSRLEVEGQDVVADVHEVLRRHEALRTTFTTIQGRPFQTVAPAFDLRRVSPLGAVAAGAGSPAQTRTRVRSAAAPARRSCSPPRHS